AVSTWPADIAAAPDARPRHASARARTVLARKVSRGEPHAAQEFATILVQFAARLRRRETSPRTCLARLRLGLRGLSRSFRPQRRNFTCCWLGPNKLLHKLCFWIAPSPTSTMGDATMPFHKARVNLWKSLK